MKENMYIIQANDEMMKLEISCSCLWRQWSCPTKGASKIYWNKYYRDCSPKKNSLPSIFRIKSFYPSNLVRKKLTVPLPIFFSKASCPNPDVPPVNCAHSPLSRSPSKEIMSIFVKDGRIINPYLIWCYLKIHLFFAIIESTGVGQIDHIRWKGLPGYLFI